MVLERWRVKSRITSHLHHIATTSDIAVSTDGEPDLSQESKTKVFVTKQGSHPLFLALTLILTVALSPNHLATSNFGFSFFQ